MWFFLFVWFGFTLTSCGDNPAHSPEGPPATDFATPRRVTIQGYSGDAMEPFLSRDGRYLLFNNLNSPTINTNLHYAERVDDLTFVYRGEIAGANTSSLEGVPTMDASGNLYFVSNRSYDTTFATIYQGIFSGGSMTNVELVSGVSIQIPSVVNFDVKVSPDGNTLYFVDAQFGSAGSPETADLVIASRSGTAFVREANSPGVLTNINTPALEYAAAISANGLELYFTRFDGRAQPPVPPAIYVAARTSLSEPFSVPRRIMASTGFVEAPTISTDRRRLYCHRRDGDRFSISMVSR